MDKLRVAFTNAFFGSNGSAGFDGYDVSPLRSHPGIEIRSLAPAKILGADTLADVDVLVTSTGETRIDRESLSGNGRLALIARAGAGYDDVDVEACSAAHVALATAGEAVRRPTAVAALTLILATATRLMDKHRITLKGAGEWSQLSERLSLDLPGRALGLVGLGSIGSEVARLVAPLQMRIIAHDPFATPQGAAAVGATLVGLETLLREADIVSLHVPLMAETHHLINAERLGLMKPTAILVNTARGKIVDQAALTECLRARRIACAGLDVLEQEPPDANDPILRLDNVVFSAHALNWTDRLNARLADINMKAVFAMMDGREPSGVVNRGVLQSAAWRQKLERIRALGAAHGGARQATST